MSEEGLYGSISSPRDEFYNHPGEQARLRWDLLRDFYQDVVRINGIQLIQLAEAPQVDKKFLKKLFQAVMKNHDLGYQGEIVRTLYNYLTSAASLADHCRRVMKLYDGTSFYDQYRDEVNKFMSLPEAVFLKELRNYITHHKVPSIGMGIGSMPVLPGMDLRSEALLYISDLNDYAKWSRTSKLYMKNNFPSVYISDLVKNHLQGLCELYSWIFPHFLDLHQAEYEESLKVKEQIMQAN